MAFALSELDRMESALGLSRNLRELATILYREAVEKNLIRGAKYGMYCFSDFIRSMQAVQCS